MPCRIQGESYEVGQPENHRAQPQTIQCFKHSAASCQHSFTSICLAVMVTRDRRSADVWGRVCGGV